MAFEPAGGFIWSDEPAHHYYDWRGQGLSLGLAAGLGATALGYGIMPGVDGRRPIDTVAHIARTLGNLSPFQVGNTFRLPEFLSPFTSPIHQKLDITGDVASTTFKRPFFDNTATQAYLKQLTGMDDAALAAVGLGKTLTPASELVFEKGVNDINGRLYSVVNDQRHLLSDNVALMQFSAETPNVVDLGTKTKPVNKAAKAVFQAMDMWQQEGFDEAHAFAAVVNGEISRPGFIPIPGFAASRMGATYLRALPAFSMERFNTLLTNVGEEVFGKGFTSTMKRLGGFGSGVLPGPASVMYGRFGMRAAGVIGVGLAVNELDWVRRQGGLPGHVGASAAVSFGLGALTARAGFGAKGGLFAGIAAFTGQMILPGFDQGVLPGIASTYVNATQLRALPINPFNYYRRTLEGFLPGVSSQGAGILTGLAVLGMANLRVPGTGNTIPNYLLQRYGHGRFGIAERTMDKGLDVFGPKNIRDHFWDEMIEFAQTKVGGSVINEVHDEWLNLGQRSTLPMRSRVMAQVYGSGMDSRVISENMNRMWSIAEERAKTSAKANPVNQALAERLDSIALKYSGKSDIVSKGLKQLEGLGEQIRHAFFGADLAEEGLSLHMGRKGFKSPLGRTGILFAAGFLTHQLATGGLLGSMEGFNELADIYSGRQLVEIQKGRYWELGGTPWEGHGTQGLRPHWYPIMMNRVAQAATWGPNEDRLSPSMKFFLQNFTYELERRTYYDRPYPISTPAFGNLPLIGPVLGATVGQLIKPAKLMHSGEWIQTNDGNLEFASVYEGWRREPAYNLGAYEPGIPRSPYDSRAVFSELNYHMRELGGLVGYSANMLSNMIVGEDIYFSDTERLAESGMMNNFRRTFWDMSLGGGGPFGEIIRRVVPSVPKDVQRRNPIMNNMPHWLPVDFRYGDPYTRMPYGEAALPGYGYERLHPELKGVDPEDYPMLYRYDILAQVSPLSNEFRETREAVYRQRAMGLFTPAQEAWVDRIDAAATKRWNIYDFERTHANSIQLPGSGVTQALWFKAQETAREQFAPIEYLIPGGFRPLQKFLPGRDMIEQYEYERMYGSNVAFWNKPWRDWIRPSAYSLAHWMGFSGKPGWRAEADSVNEYFDQAEFYKWMSLAEQAEQEGRERDKIRYQYMAANTRMGVNPQGNPLSIYWTLPAEDRAFFNAFAFAEGSDRDRILQMVPSDQVHLYQTLWSRMDSEDPRLWAGGPTGPDENYLYRQLHGMNTNELPPVDWIGWHQDVDIRDIKVRYVNELGRDMRDFGLWEQELRKAYSQPYLDGSTAGVYPRGLPFRGAVMRNMGQLFGDGRQPTDISVFNTNAYQGDMSLEYNDDRYSEIQGMVNGYINGL